MKTGFSALNCNWVGDCAWGRLGRSNSLAAGEELVTGPKVPSDLLQLKSGHSNNLDFTRLLFVTSLYAFDVQLWLEAESSCSVNELPKIVNLLPFSHSIDD